MRDEFSLVIGYAERCLLSIVAIFLAAIVIGVAAQGGGTGHLRTVELNPRPGTVAVTSAP